MGVRWRSLQNFLCSTTCSATLLLLGLGSMATDDASDGDLLSSVRAAYPG